MQAVSARNSRINISKVTFSHKLLLHPLMKSLRKSLVSAVGKILSYYFLPPPDLDFFFFHRYLWLAGELSGLHSIFLFLKVCFILYLCLVALAHHRLSLIARWLRALSYVRDQKLNSHLKSLPLSYLIPGTFATRRLVFQVPIA